MAVAGCCWQAEWPDMLIYGIWTLLELRLDFCVAKVDLRNAFNEAQACDHSVRIAAILGIVWVGTLVSCNACTCNWYSLVMCRLAWGGFHI